MLQFKPSNLRAMARLIQDRLFSAHRGAIVHGRFRSVIVFGNDGHHDEPVGKAALEKTRAALLADGFQVGKVAMTRDRYTWVFEVDPPESLSVEEAVVRCDDAVWEGWAAARNLDPDTDIFAVLQRGIADGQTGVTLMELNVE